MRQVMHDSVGRSLMSGAVMGMVVLVLLGCGGRKTGPRPTAAPTLPPASASAQNGPQTPSPPNPSAQESAAPANSRFNRSAASSRPAPTKSAAQPTDAEPKQKRTPPVYAADATASDLPDFSFNAEAMAKLAESSSSTFRGQSALKTKSSPAGKLSASDAAGLVQSLVTDASQYAPTLVVWLIDRSASAGKLRAELAEQLSPGYAAQAAKVNANGGDRLLTAVATFGEQVNFAVDPPSPDGAVLGNAFQSLAVDTSGKELAFAAVRAVLEKYATYRTDQRRELLLVMVTDEAGDDAELVDGLLDQPKKLAIPIYVVGVPAPFGRQAALPGSVEPVAGDAAAANPNDTKSIRQGPESRYLERIQLGFWEGESDSDLLDAGFGPFALERLCRASGGRYLALRTEASDYATTGRYSLEWPTAGAYRPDPVLMRKYAPDDLGDADYLALVESNGAMRALHAAAKLPAFDLQDFSQLVFVKQSEAELANQLSRAQQAAAKLEPAVNAFYDTLEQGEADRGKVIRLRWQAGYDLAMGRATAVKARVDGFNAMLAELKRGKPFANPNSTTWVLQPHDTIDTSSQLKRLVEKAQMYLNRVVQEHPSTPWARMAERELQTPIGWKWSEQ